MGKKGQPGTHFIELGVSGYTDILILNTYPARPLSLSMGKKGQPGTHFNRKLQVKLEVRVSHFMDILILSTYPARSSSLHDNGTGNTLPLLSH